MRVSCRETTSALGVPVADIYSVGVTRQRGADYALWSSICFFFVFKFNRSIHSHHMKTLSAVLFCKREGLYDIQFGSRVFFLVF